MKTKSKALLLTLCAVLLVAASVLGTMAYLTSQDKVTNTFTVGSVAITLDEIDVSPDGRPVADAGRVQANEYKLLPGHTYTKDPTVHVADNSEDCWVFVQVENGIATYEASGNTIAAQIAANGWTELDGVDNVYYKQYVQGGEEDLKVFDSFTIAGNADAEEGWSDVNGATVTVTAYAVQKDGFDTAKAAWNATFGA